MNEPLTIYCDCKLPDCGMTLTVLPMGQHVKLTMTPRAGVMREPAMEWISLAGLAKRLEGERCRDLGIFEVYHYLREELDLDMLISEDNRQVLLALAKGEKVTA